MTKRTWLKVAAFALIAVLAVAGCTRTNAQEGGSGGGRAAVREAPASDFRYVLTDNGQGVRITRYTGNGGVVSIPATIEDMPVLEIGRRAFFQNDSITELFVPSSVTILGNDAFREMSSLTKVTLPNGIKTFPEGVFRNCGNLTTLNLPASLELMELLVFNRSRELTNLIIPDSLSSISFQTVFTTPQDQFEGLQKLPLATRARLQELGYTGSF
jgi:hypothetical protein